MKKAAIFVITAVLFAVCLPAFAAQFPDVPTDHWAYAAVQDLADKGVVVGYPDGTFGGKRALTRYEFAQALSRAIPEIAKLAGAGSEGAVGPQGPAGPAGPAGPGLSAEELANIQRLIAEFKDELAAQGVDIQALKKDVAALSQRVSAVEAEQARVKITAEVPIAWEGRISNRGNVFDIDGRPFFAGEANPLRDNEFFNDIDLKIKGQVSNNASVTALISAGNYDTFAIENFNNFSNEQFDLFNLYLNAAVNLGPLGNAQATVGRFPFQLTPLTMKFVSPDSYIYNSKFQNGDFAIDGAKVVFNVSKANVTAFAGKSVNSLGLDQTFVGFSDFIYDQFAGARAGIGFGRATNLGLTYYVAGNDAAVGRTSVYGADLKTNIAKFGLWGEWAQTKQSDAIENALGTFVNDKNDAWNANLGYKLGKLDIGGGYSEVGWAYAAPGYWNRAGRAVNIRNVKGWNANLGFAISNNLSISANGQFLKTANNDGPISFRQATTPELNIFGGLDKLTSWKTGLKYNMSNSNSIDLGWEEVQWKPDFNGSGAKERYYTVGVGHSFNTNSTLKLLYQIIDYKAGDFDIYSNSLSSGSYRGGLTAAEFLLKY